MKNPLCWISVEERLPEEPISISKWKIYLVSTSFGCEIAGYVGNGRWVKFPTFFGAVEPTHWVDNPKGKNETLAA